MKQRFTVQFAVLLMLFMSLPLAAKVSGLPDFTELVEKAGPAVVNIRVTQFGTRSRRPSDQNNLGSLTPWPGDRRAPAPSPREILVVFPSPREAPSPSSEPGIVPSYWDRD